jgi:DnaJ-class molecular chaperone
VRRAAEPKATEAPVWDPLDASALRDRVATRRALVEEGDYFALLGVDRNVTQYDLRRAYQALRRDLDPDRVLTAATVDLRNDVEAILEVVDEAYDILRDPVRRERYRRALERAPD